MKLKSGYKRTEVGVIPEDWMTSSVGEVSTTSSGTTPPRALADRYFRNGTIPWVKTLDLNNGEIRNTDECITHTALKETCLKLFPSDTVLVAMYGGYAQIGRTGLLKKPATVNQALTAILPDVKKASSGYIFYTLNYRVEYWKSVASSSRKDPNITGSDVRAFPLALPSVKEQKIIAKALGDVSALIESLEQLLNKKHRIKQGVMQELLTGQRRLSGFRGKWEPVSMGEIFTFSGGLAASRDQLTTDGYCYLHYGDIHMSNKTHVSTMDDYEDIPKLEISLSKVNRKSLLNDGDVVFVDASEDDAGISKHVVVLNQEEVVFISGLHTIVAKSIGGFLCNLYKRYCFQVSSVKEQFRFFAVGTKVSGISKSNIARVMLQVPPLEEQTAIASVLSSMDDEIFSLEGQLRKTRQIKQGMMQDLLTGRIRLV